MAAWAMGYLTESVIRDMIGSDRRGAKRQGRSGWTRKERHALRNLIPAVEQELGPERLARLRRDPDAYQQFWLGVLEATARVDWTRESLAFLISNGFGAVRNMRRSERSWNGMKVCRSCGKTYGYRAKTCLRCGAELETQVRLSEFDDLLPSREDRSVEAILDVKAFVETLDGKARYVARRWMLERADLYYVNYQKQIAFELGVSAPRVAQIVKALKAGFVTYVNRDREV